MGNVEGAIMRKDPILLFAQFFRYFSCDKLIVHGPLAESRMSEKPYRGVSAGGNIFDAPKVNYSAETKNLLKS